MDYLKEKLDKVFAEYIRKRDSQRSNYCLCISCGRLVHLTDADVGHFIPRSFTGTRWHEQNAHLQCQNCNRFNDGNVILYENELVKKYGISVVGALHRDSRKIVKMSDADYRNMIEYYKFKLSEL